MKHLQGDPTVTQSEAVTNAETLPVKSHAPDSSTHIKSQIYQH